MGSSVKRSLVQSQEAPSALAWLEIFVAYCSFQAHMRCRNFSRPKWWRVSPSLASSRSTITWVAIPA